SSPCWPRRERSPPACGAAKLRTPTPLTHMHYFPVGIGLATLFAAILLGLLLLLQIGLLSRAYSALGLDPRVATLALFGSLLGSYINLPLLHLPAERIVSREVVEIFGVPFLAPVTA